tara:strand:- start:260 stop:526 length:267 start_codon:yes stop_codon:yes gene_type:complete
MSDKIREEFQKLIPKKLGSVQSANSISNRDLKRLEDAFIRRQTGGKGLLKPKRKATQSANSISNKDIKMLENMLNRNDGGMAKKTRVF